MSEAHDFGIDVSGCVIVIIVVSVKCGGISQVCQGRREMGMTNMTQTG